ncbi:hypothetical protein FOA52_007168 [Chlamydomonas sp. UWO 241]|nr:hypothetical protein FOA52_007168 [Chlamydomonas sp. UWO 241]
MRPCSGAKHGGSHAAAPARQQQQQQHRRALLLAALALAELAAALCPPGGCSAGMALITPVGAATHRRAPISEWLPHCTRLVGRLSPHQAQQLRAAHQQYLGASARRDDLEQAIHFKQNPAQLKEVDAHTWDTPRTLEELRAERDAEETTKQKQLGEMTKQIRALKADGLVPESAKLEDVGPCVAGELDAGLFPGTPTVSFLLQYFKRPHMIDALWRPLAAIAKELHIQAELVANVDSSAPGEPAAWANLSYASNGFVVPVFSANVHEIRAYNRAAGIARGEFIVMLQDDQILPGEGDSRADGVVWIKNMLAAFRKYEAIGVIGFQSYRFCMEHGANRYQGNFPFREPELGVGMAFAQVVDFGPLAVRASAFEAVGGLDEGLSDAGVCGIYSDWELSHRMWASGWHVAYMPLQGRKEDNQAESGTHKPETGVRCWGRQMGRAGGMFTERWKPLFQHICDTASELNVRLLEAVRPEDTCPFQDKMKLPCADAAGLKAAVEALAHTSAANNKP